MSQPTPNTLHAFPWARMAIPLLAALALLIGVVLVLLPEEQNTIGWVSYEPLPETIGVPDAASPLPSRALLGIALAAIGALTLAFYCGWAFARRGLAR